MRTIRFVCVLYYKILCWSPVLIDTIILPTSYIVRIAYIVCFIFCELCPNISQVWGDVKHIYLLVSYFFILLTFRTRLCLANLLQKGHLFRCFDVRSTFFRLSISRIIHYNNVYFVVIKAMYYVELAHIYHIYIKSHVHIFNISIQWKCYNLSALNFQYDKCLINCQTTKQVTSLK